MRKILLILLICIFTNVQSRKRPAFNNKGLKKVGKVMGNAVVGLFKAQKPIIKSIPQGYKRQIQKPIKQEYTMAYKLMNGTKNIIILSILAAIIFLGFISYRVYSKMMQRKEDMGFFLVELKWAIKTLLKNYSEEEIRKIKEHQRYENFRNKRQANWRDPKKGRLEKIIKQKQQKLLKMDMMRNPEKYRSQEDQGKKNYQVC